MAEETLEMHHEMQDQAVKDEPSESDGDDDKQEIAVSSTGNCCINFIFNRQYQYCFLWWIITFILLTAISMLIIRFSLENMVALIIMSILLIIPCFILCGIKCKFKKSISIIYHFIIYTIAVLIGAFLGGIWRAAEMCYFEEPTFEIWSNWNDIQNYGTVEALINAAILASTPHNSQSYKFKINNIADNHKQLDIFVDFSRNIEYIDIIYREMHIGIGCAMENALLSASFNKFKTNVTYFPNINTDKSHIARIDLYPSTSTSTSTSTIINGTNLLLYNNIPNRHTDRYEYDKSKSIDSTKLDEIENTLNEYPDTIQLYWFETETEKDIFGDIEIESVEALIGDERQSKGGYEWVRHSCNEYKTKKSGIWYDAAGLSDFVEFIGKVFPPVTREEEDQYWLNNEKAKKGSCSVYAIIAARNHTDNLQRVYVGRYWQKIHLYGTQNGISMQPLNQILERRDIEIYDNCSGDQCIFTNKLIELMDIINATDINQPLFAFRAGYGIKDDIFKSARRSAMEVTI